MGKLDGNERWQSKMLLSDHIEQYEQQHNSVKNAGRATIEELTMLRDYLLLPHMVTMVEKSLADIEHSGNIMKRAYLMAGQHVLDRITKDMYRLRRELKQRNIKILGEEHNDFIVYTQINCRGYSEKFPMTRDVMRSEISLRLTKYTAEIGTLLKNEANNK
ncbi:hypothetical protein D3C75_461990 [compost metagenome]